MKRKITINVRENSWKQKFEWQRQLKAKINLCYKKKWRENFPNYEIVFEQVFAQWTDPNELLKTLEQLDIFEGHLGRNMRFPVD